MADRQDTSGRKDKRLLKRLVVGAAIWTVLVLTAGFLHVSVLSILWCDTYPRPPAPTACSCEPLLILPPWLAVAVVAVVRRRARREPDASGVTE
jgi:hypothetical protein